MIEPGLNSAPECNTLSATSPRHIQDPLPPEEASLERASCVPHNSETAHANSHFINQKSESEEALTPTLTESDKLVTTQVRSHSLYSAMGKCVTICIVDHFTCTFSFQQHEDFECLNSVDQGPLQISGNPSKPTLSTLVTCGMEVTHVSRSTMDTKNSLWSLTNEGPLVGRWLIQLSPLCHRRRRQSIIVQSCKKS